MNTNEFVTNLRIVVEDGATKGVVRTLHKPAGRNPEARTVRLSEWFSLLESMDREKVMEVIALSTKQATYNMLLVLDGTLAIESGGKGKLELTHVDAAGKTLINDPSAEELSVIFKDVRP